MKDVIDNHERPSENKNRTLYTPEEVAKTLGVTAYTVREWIRTGKIEAFKVNRRLKIKESEVKKLSNNGRPHKPTSK